MRGSVVLSGGGAFALPQFTQWEILRTDGEGCDSFQLCFPGDMALFTQLRGARHFFAQEQGKRVFTGLVDEMRFALDERGGMVTLDGRGMGALLLDNQLREQEFQTACLEDLLKLCTVPFGISVRGGGLGTLSGFRVDTGDTCRQALWGFVRHAGGGLPRFDEYGTLLIAQPGKTVRIQGGAAALKRSRCYCDSLSCVVEVPARVRGQVQVTQNPAPEALPHQRVTVVSGAKLPASRYTAQEQIARSERDSALLELTLPGSFLASPGDLCQLALPALGLMGSFLCRSVRSSGGPDGLLCRLSLEDHKEE